MELNFKTRSAQNYNTTGHIWIMYGPPTPNGAPRSRTPSAAANQIHYTNVFPIDLLLVLKKRRLETGM